MSQIILYDLPSKGRCACWSPNPWKPRLALNYKGLDYKTEWIEYPDIAPRLSSLGIPPNETGVQYTIPAATFSGNKHVMDSKAIAHALEAAHPSPSLHLDSPILIQVEAILPNLATAFFPNAQARVPRVILNDASAPYFESTREKRFGMPLAQYERENGGAKAYEKAREPLRALAAILRENGGPYFMGAEPSYADFMVVGFMQFVRRAGEDNFEAVLAVDAAFGRLYEACKPWLARDDH